MELMPHPHWIQNINALRPTLDASGKLPQVEF